ncbi:putative RNA polymerase [Clostridium phage HM T]|uniref:Uncharacterized protein n=1 Tax=Clostridium saccharoperbutylacetonicum N1-4(HMT) TaxID=931276 RepID=M1MT92_9CLOT|nr:hypothetical protein [Clostridium saccharoperbutylacetonicum]AMB17425.1 putative RNA polymerase [Clostridium phage HM T]AGF54777.1 hypothetical protein Cspa_c10010 [Clostridium saccharoperbutylacetonicum N1-4(HMT)]NRT58702.1 hypothetical protein [Clostridium saccharoperbutylacetonicum]NSB27891.1 hypothetical protein [Clostridium saccharoperbutylacetonicum]NSB41374.1 hypothetical protein [Clostridium saccharoperbutylacetonicum]
MVLEFLSDLKSKISKENYNIIFAMAREDIRFNRTSFNKKTTPEEFIEIFKRCYVALSKCK